MPEKFTPHQLTAVRHALSSYGRPVDLIARFAASRCAGINVAVTLDCLEQLVADGVVEKSRNEEGPIGWRLKP